MKLIFFKITDQDMIRKDQISRYVGDVYLYTFFPVFVGIRL